MAVGPSGPGPAGCITSAWVSSDGDAWDPRPFDRDLACLSVADVVAGASLVVAVGSDYDTSTAAIAISRDDGVTWERAAAGASLAGVSRLDSVAVGPSGYVAYGPHGDGGIGVWTSPDGLDWRLTSSVGHLPGLERSWVSDTVPFGPGFVLVGGSSAAADSLAHDVLVSGDGVTLRRAPWAPSTWGESTMAAATTLNGRLYVVGTGGAFWLEPATPLLWTAELGPTP